MLKILWRERSKAKQMSQYRHIPRPAPGYSYTVQRGDTLKSIAMQAYSDDSQPVLQAIYNANRRIIGDDPDWLVAGQVLHIPVSPNAEPATVDLTNVELANPIPGKDYKVQRDDTIQSIAKQAYKNDSPRTWKALHNANKRVIGNNPHWMVAGQVLHIPVSIKDYLR